MKHFTFIPSLSTAVIFKSFQDNIEIGGKTIKFWDNSIGENLHHPAYLITAGNHYKNFSVCKDLGINVNDPNILIMADSGGHQIATGAMKYSPEIVDEIFKWLEENSNVAINLDIPPRSKKYSYEESKKMSESNFKYFYENQTGKTKFLSVFQGNTYEQMMDWYNMSSKYPFKGWAAGVGSNFNQTILTFATLLDKKEHLKTHNEFFHILGVSRIDTMFILEKIQQLMNAINPSIKITSDSSSPSRAASFGTLYSGVNWDTLTYKSVTITNKQKYDDKSSLIYATKYDDFLFKHVPASEVFNWTPMGYTAATLHNFYFILETIKKIQSIVYCDDSVMKQAIPITLYNVFKSLEEMFNSDSPLKIYNKYISLYDKFKQIDTEMEVKTNFINDFFNFK